jgi:predicted Zn-dependent protease
VTHRFPRLLAPALTALALLAGCSSAPPAREKKPEVVLRTEAHDERAGAEAAEQVAAEIGLLEDRALTSYVSQIGQRLARHAPRGRFSYKFQVVDQDAPNAFALPGGYVFVSRGLLVLSNSEDELANVIGHEIVHVARRHAAARQSLMRDLPAIFRHAAIGQVASYSRDQEREADRLGQGLSAVAGFDPQGMADFLKNLDYSERLRLGHSRMPGYLDTHPTTGERVAAAGARARSVSWKRQPAIAGGRNAYLRRLDGLVIGTASTEGVFAGDRFLHPELGFSMRFPADWELANTRRAVGAISPRRDGQVFLEFQGRGSDPEQASAEFIEEAREQGLRIDSSRPVRIGELAAFRVLGRAATVGVHLTWIARKGTIYRLTGVSMRGSGGLEGVFNNVARSFRPLTPRERASIRETRLRLVPARAEESIAELSRRTGNEWNIQQTAVMNDVFANERLEAGRLMKIAVSQPYRSAGGSPTQRAIAAGSKLCAAWTRPSIGTLVRPIMLMAVTGSTRK